MNANFYTNFKLSITSFTQASQHLFFHHSLLPFIPSVVVGDNSTASPRFCTGEVQDLPQILQGAPEAARNPTHTLAIRFSLSTSFSGCTNLNVPSDF